jgi:two-component sensor histidine kinase
MHAEDRKRVEAVIEGALEHGEAPGFEVEYRFIRPRDGTTRWLVSRGSILRDPETGEPRRVLGIALDVTERKEAEERQRLLAREVDHRAKNALAVVQAAVRLTPKEDAAGFARAIEGRVRALARAHTLLAEGRWSGTDLRVLAEGEMAPFLRAQPQVAVAASGGGSAAAPVALSGPPVRLGPAAAQAISMALHELATNATKYGALSLPGGTVRLDWEVDGTEGALRLRWAEQGGPPVSAPPTRRGFGSRVVEATVRDQLGGTVTRRWATGGLVCDMTVPLDRVRQA